MPSLCRRIAADERFQSFILFLILASSLLLALESDPRFVDNYGELLALFQLGTQVLFALELAVRLLAYAPRVQEFFREPWNRFDFCIIAGSFLPGVGPLALLARLLRILRVFRLISGSDRLRRFSDRLKESFDEALQAACVGAVFAYVFAIAGNLLFGETDPGRWGSLGRAFLSVFYLSLLQDVPSLMDPLLAAAPGNALFFLLFYLAQGTLLLGTIATAVADFRQGSA